MAGFGAGADFLSPRRDIQVQVNLTAGLVQDSRNTWELICRRPAPTMSTMPNMRAAVLQKDRTLVVEDVPVPELLPGSAVVKVLAVQIANFATDVVSGEHSFRPVRTVNVGELCLQVTSYCPGALPYPHGEPPVVLGTSAVGEVLRVAEDVHHVHAGDVVFCDPLVSPSANNRRA